MIRKFLSVCAFVSLLGACASSNSSGSAPSLVGDWIYENAAQTADEAVAFRSDGTYTWAVIVEASTTSANASVETGTYTSSGSTITVTPTQSSCPGPDKVSQATYSFQGGNLELATPSAAVVFRPNTSTGSSSVAIIVGCFDANGTFTKEPLAPVSN